MRKNISYLAASLAVLAIVSGAPAQAQLQFIEESFEVPAGWNWGLPTEVLDSGGSPGAYIQSALLDTALPKLRTEVGVSSPFVGDYRAAGVAGVSVTLRLDAVDFSADGRDLSVELTNDGGTPFDVSDDCSAYLVGNENGPLPGEDWKRYVLRIPSGSVTLPTGWNLLSSAGNRCLGLTDDEAWELVITDVSQLKFTYGDPSFFYIFQQWTGLALDNPTIAFGP